MSKLTSREMEFLKESNAIEGVYDYNSLVQAIEAWKYLKTQKEMNPGVVLKTHKILMLHQPLMPDERGYFRKVPVWIGANYGIDWKIIPERIDIWCKNAWLWPQRWKEHHIQYEKIHGFVDGNGRTGRMFMNWQRLKAKLPIYIVHAGEEQMEYYKWFEV